MFYKNNREGKLVHMMSQEGEFLFTNDQSLDSKVIKLPYKNSSFSMMISLPNKVDGLAELETSLNFEKLQARMLDVRRYCYADVKLSLPKFKLDLNFPLKSCLMELGIVDLFDIHSSDLSGMSGGGDLFVSDVAHKAFINVEEKGTEAAAAAMDFHDLQCLKNVEVFKADHPFMFFIYDQSIKSIVFMGKVADMS